ncbi:MAG: aspartyl protease family protein [candidate division WOR-3 bacterium]|nr:MAG: aspartyl protease family protein [candidate division WOR-3 bacterium]
MKKFSAVLRGITLIICLTAVVSAEEKIDDPYMILEKHHAAIGGLDRLRSIQTLYAEGTVSIIGSDLTGSLVLRTAKPLKRRQEVDFKIAKMISGDNGDFRWSLDANGKILIHRDESVITEREVQRHMENFEHLDPGSEYFAVTFKGMDAVDGKECYVVEVRNSINETFERHFYSTESYYLLKRITFRPDREEHTTYSDFREVDGMILPFLELTKTLPTGEQQQMVYTKYEYDKQFDPILFEPPQDDVDDFEFVNGSSAENVPFHFIARNIYVPVNIDGKERLWVLDCGASVTVIDSGFAAELGLEFQGPIKAQAASGVVDLYYVSMPSFRLQGVVFKEQLVMTMSLRPLFEKVHGMEVVGVLGYDFLSRFVTRIDYANEELSFYHPNDFTYTGKGSVIDAPLSEARMFSIPVTVDNTYSGKWQLDIGASGNDFSYPYANEQGLLGRKGVESISFGASGPSKSIRTRFDEIAVAGFRVENPVIDIPMEEGTGVFSGRSLAGNIGNTFFRHFVLYLDYERQQVIFEKGDDYETKFPDGKGGVQLWYNDNHEIEVMFVAPGTPAEKTGLQKGDIIKAINGIEVDYFENIIAIRELFAEKAGTTYQFSVLRDGKAMEVNLVLKDLY